jgi:hypothetical protein
VGAAANDKVEPTFQIPQLRRLRAQVSAARLVSITSAAQHFKSCKSGNKTSSEQVAAFFAFLLVRHSDKRIVGTALTTQRPNEFMWQFREVYYAEMGIHVDERG